MVALTLLGFHGNFWVATTWWTFDCAGNSACYFLPGNLLVRKLTLIHDACFLVIFPWQQPLAPRHWNDHGSRNEAGAERERSGFDDFNVFSRFSIVFLPAASLPLRSRFTPAFFFSCFLNVFCSFSSCCFFIFCIFEYVFWFFRRFYIFFPGIVSFFWTG